MSDLLAIDSSGSACSVALGRGEDVLARHREAPRQQIQMVLPMVDELLAKRGTTLARLDGIAFGQGPGSFTGIRIALAVAQGLAMAHELPVVGISSLAALAQGAHRGSGREAFLVAQDARMGEVYWGCYQIVDGAALLRGGEQLSAPGGVVAPDACRWWAVGDAWQKYDMASTGIAQPPDPQLLRVPEARDLLLLAERAFASGGATTARQARASYLRDRVVQRPARNHN